MGKFLRTGILFFCCGFLLMACASVPPPKEQLAVSQATMSKAEEAGAFELAPLEFTAAQEKLREAQVAMERKDNLAALRLAEQAQVDADLAYYKARSAQAQKAVRQLNEGIEALRRELEAGS